VRAVVRRAADAPAAWAADAGIETVAADLGAEAAAPALRAALDGAVAVIHAAASLAGGDAAQARDTLAPTAALLDRLAECPAPPLLVLVGSLAVCLFAAMPDGTQLDETTPADPDLDRRDAYTRAKRAQEALVVQAVQRRGLDARIVRPGAVVGSGRLRTARLGLGLGPLLVMPGGAARVPLIAVEDCAALLVLAATRPLRGSDVPVIPGGGRLEIIHAVDPDPPTQAAYAAALARAGWPRRVLRLPLGLARAPGRAAALAGLVLPGLVRRLPGLLKAESFEARFKPLRYATARAEDRLGWRPARPFAASLAAYLDAGARP
jgi:UDP-glucose 4-epimerase